MQKTEIIQRITELVKNIQAMHGHDAKNAVVTIPLQIDGTVMNAQISSTINDDLQLEHRLNFSNEKDSNHFGVTVKGDRLMGYVSTYMMSDNRNETIAFSELTTAVLFESPSQIGTCLLSALDEKIAQYEYTADMPKSTLESCSMHTISPM